MRKYILNKSDRGRDTQYTCRFRMFGEQHIHSGLVRFQCELAGIQVFLAEAGQLETGAAAANQDDVRGFFNPL